MATIKNAALLVIAVIITNCLLAQSSYNNDWIDYSKTYYKFKVGTFGTDFEGQPIKKGLVRVTGAALKTAGMGDIPMEQLQLLRNGREVRFYPSKLFGPLADTDYIEFWGESADGRIDKDLYKDPSYQLSDYWSLATDSSTYFLTVNIASNMRYTTIDNEVAAATIQPEKNFVYTLGKYYREMVNPGFGAVASPVILYSSAYDRGEGLTSNYSGIAMSWQAPKMYYDNTSSLPINTRIAMAGANLNMRNVQIDFGAITAATVPLNYFNTTTANITNINKTGLDGDAPLIFFHNLTTAEDDNFVVSKIEIDYPRVFDFGRQSSFEFSLPASDTGRYLIISNFSDNGSIPLLYDITNGNRYVANTDVAGKLRFLLRPSTQAYQLALVRGDNSAAANINTLEKKNFADYTNIANQGNYIIITSPILADSAGGNYIEKYKQYRSSAEGGNYKVIVADISDLEDQFAFGIKMHPLAVKNFLRYARSKFATAPAYAFIIGKGLTYSAYRLIETDNVVQQTALVPTFGMPGSDNLLSSDNYDPIPTTPIGRLSVISPKEVGDYLEKIKQYEHAQDSAQTLASKGWMKNVLQLTGVNDPALGQTLDDYMSAYKSIISDSAFGGKVTTFSKSADPSEYPEEVVNFTGIFNRGSSLVTYFGHSSSTHLDFSLDDPANYNNTGRYPVFIVNGCLAGNIFDYDAGRLSNFPTISEKFVLQPQKGAIGYLATTSFGVVEYLDTYTREFYKSIATRQYGKGFGIVVKDAITSGINIYGTSDYYGRLHAEQYAFHGDPALKMNPFDKPDYVLDSTNVKVSPAFISVADDSFAVKVVVNNIGKATNDSVHFSFFRKLPGGDSTLVFAKKFGSIKTADSVSFKVGILPNRDNGITNFVAHIDDDNRINEINEDNNILQIPVTISAAEIRPVFPYNYSIVNTASVTLAASTANPLDTLKKYVIQIDTTASFNSPLLASYQKSSKGGVIQQAVTLGLDNTVYYWRVAAKGSGHWNTFSFTHRSSAGTGFEQAHFYQHTGSFFNKLSEDSASRSLTFTKSLINLFVKQAIYPYGGNEDADFSVAVNGTYVAQSACIGSSVIFNVFNPLTFKPYPNTTSPYGASTPCRPVNNNDFEFYVGDPSTRNNAVQFLDNFVHDGDYVVARSIDVPSDMAPQWAADTAIYGHNNSLYQRLKDQGIDIDGYNFPRCYIFIFKKNDKGNFTPVTVYSNGYYDAINASKDIAVADTAGYMISPKFGPAKAWSKVTWKGNDINANNVTSLNVIGVDKDNNEKVLYTIDKTTTVKDISAVNVATYPYLRLQMSTQDSLTAAPYQLQDWAVEYTPVPEGAIAPNMGVNLPDSVHFNHLQNESPDTLKGYVVFKNVSIFDFNALRVKLVLYDSAGKAHTYPVKNTKPLVAGDTVVIRFIANVMNLPKGKYSFNLFVNPDGAQPEQYLFNNSLFKYVSIGRDVVHPVHLLSFTGQPQGKAVLLNWKSTNEINFSHYDVEFGADARNFVKVGEVASKNNNGAGVNEYSFVHGSPIIGKNYYRLKVVDKDGAFVYSTTIIVDFAGSNKISVYPNPFTSTLQVTGNGNKNTVRVLDVNGKVVLTQVFSGAGIVLDVSNLAAGTYMVQVNDGSKPQLFKVQKQSN